MELDGSKKNTFEKLNNIVSSSEIMTELFNNSQTFRKRRIQGTLSGRKVKKLSMHGCFMLKFLNIYTVGLVDEESRSSAHMFSHYCKEFQH